MLFFSVFFQACQRSSCAMVSTKQRPKLGINIDLYSLQRYVAEFMSVCSSCMSYV